MKTTKLLSASILGLLLAVIHPALGATAFFATLSGKETVKNASHLFLNLGFFNPNNLSLPDQGVTMMKELIYTAKFKSPAWTEFMDYESGIKHKKQLILIGHYEGLSGSVRSDCDNTPNPNTIGATEKFWDPAYISDRHEECFANLQGSFWKYMLANGLKKEDLTQSDYDAFVLDRLSEYMNDDFIYRLIFFSDKSIISGVTNNLAGGDLKYFNAIDGVFKQLEAIVATTPARRTTITENAGATYLLQAFATASPTVHPATDSLNKLIFDSSMELRGVNDPVILVTQSVADQYAKERMAVTNIELAYLRTEQGMKFFEIGGIKIIPIYTWDRLLKRHFDNGTVVLNPHRMLYTSKSNIRVGTEEEANLSELESNYDKYHKKWFVDYGFNLDVKVIDDNLVQYGY